MSHVIPDLVYKALIKQSPFEIIGDGEQVRTFTHAKDIARGVRLIIEKGIINEDFNFCGKTSSKIAELAVKVWEKVNPGVDFPRFKFLPAPPSDVRFRVGISTKAKDLLGWKPEYTLDDIIDDVYKFIKRNFETMGGKL
jgi:nucleoside-diphosphate-sugar epimerase